MIRTINSYVIDGSFFGKHCFLSIYLILTLIQAINCKTIESNKIDTKSVPKIITLQTYRDWSSRLGANQTIPQSAALLFEESKEVLTTDYGDNRKDITSTEKANNNMRPSMSPNRTQTQNKTNLIVKDNNSPVNAHKVAAQVLSRILHISPLLALASNSVPYREPDYNRTSYERKELNKNIEKSFEPTIESLNEIDIDSGPTPFKSERISASGISFPSTPPTTTLSDITLSMPEIIPTEQTPAEYAEEDHHHDNDEHEEEEPPIHEDHEDYDDDEEEESYRYPVKVNYQDPEYDSPVPERDISPPFVIPNININPESLKQKGCRTVVKEVQAIPMENGLHGNGQNQNNAQTSQTAQNPVVRTRRDTNDGNSRKFTSIVMTKECHFPGDEGAGSEEVPQTLPTLTNTAMSDSKQEITYLTPTPPHYDEYDEDFDFRPQLHYRSSGLEDTMEPKPSNYKKSYADSPSFRRDNSEFSPTNDFNFDDNLFDDFNERSDNRKNPSKKQKKKNKKKPEIRSSLPSVGIDFDDEDFGPQPKSARTKSRGSKPPVYRSQGGAQRGQRPGKKGNKRKPKKVNRSFAFFRKAEPKNKDPNESDFAVSYGRGNFQSFSDSYDSDKDGPRKGKKRSKTHKEEEEDDD